MNPGWPTKKDKVFVCVTQNSDPNSWLDSMRREQGLAAAYKESADLIIQNILSRDVVERDAIYISPVIYLYRHSIELSLKRIIAVALKLKLLQATQKLESDLAGHALHPLWNHAKSAIHSYWPNADRTAPSNVERVITELHRVDPSGQIFRYAKDKSGHYNDQNSIVIDFSNMRMAFNNAFTFLESCCYGMDDIDFQ